MLSVCRLMDGLQEGNRKTWRSYNGEMKIFMVCPAPAGSRKGNRVTADRWNTLLKKAGHQVAIATDWVGQACDVLLALHARKSYPAVHKYRQEHPTGPLIVALTGTDLYRDLPRNVHAQRSLRYADRLIGLHENVASDLPEKVRAKLRVILQSAEPIEPRPARSEKFFQVCVLGHLRYEKDPLRTAEALRRLPHLKQIRVVHAGQALIPRYQEWTAAAMQLDSRYRWLGGLPLARAQRLLASSRLLVISSRMEGGANVVGEAIVNGVPILASHIPGNVGLLGPDYPGYFPVNDARALARLLEKACCYQQYYKQLEKATARLAPRFEPAREQAALAALMREVSSAAR